MTTHHHLHAGVDTCHWGVFAASIPPVLRVRSGDAITVDTVSGGADVLPPPGFHVPPELHEIHARSARILPGHILTGPVFVEDAEPGDTLEVRILDVRLRQDWGYNMIRPLAGTLPDEFDAYRLLHIPLDAERMTGRLPWGLDLPLHPFFGILGVAPPVHWARINTIVPRAHGGNLDNKELQPGSSLFLPVHVRAPSSRAATATPHKATARSAPRPSKPRCRAASNWCCTSAPASAIRAPKRPRT